MQRCLQASETRPIDCLTVAVLQCLRQSFRRSYECLSVSGTSWRVKINPVPFLFLPAFVAIGFALDGWWSVTWGLGAWCVVVVAGTLIHMTRVMQSHAENDELSKFVERASSVVVE